MVDRKNLSNRTTFPLEVLLELLAANEPRERLKAKRDRTEQCEKSARVGTPLSEARLR